MHGYYKNCGGKVGHRRTEKCTGMYVCMEREYQSTGVVGGRGLEYGMDEPRGRWMMGGWERSDEEDV